MKNFESSSHLQASRIPQTSQRNSFAPISSDIKQLVVQKVLNEQSMSWEKAQFSYNISHASVGRILKQEKEKRKSIEASSSPPKKRGRKSPLDNGSILLLILKKLEKNSQITLKELKLELENEQGFITSISALDRALSKMDITWKVAMKIPVDWNTPETIQARFQYVTDFQIKFLERSKVFIDESSFNLHTKKKNGRALAGEKATLTLLPKGRNLSLMMGINKDGVPHYRIIRSFDKKHGSNAEDFRNFIQDLASKVRFRNVMSSAFLNLNLIN